MSRNEKINYTIIIFLLLLVLICCSPEVKKPMNILMIAVDDLRPELGCYGNTVVKSPNIDEFASESMLFQHSYCNIPVSGASRASLLTGTRPTKNRFIHYYTRADVEVPEAVSLPKHFKEMGYYTISNGKIFHHMNDMEESWDENWRPRTNPTWRDYYLDNNVELELAGGGPPWEAADVSDTAYHDGKLAGKTIADLKRLKNLNKPFFIASGFIKPHLPFNAPQKYWDIYSRDQFNPVEKSFWPSNAPKEAFHNSGELRAYHGIPEEGFISDSSAISMQHGYYACVSYIDAQIGKVLDALEELGLAENTIVILWGDHGWNLGDHGMWCKHCNFNTSLQTPLIIKAPGFPKGQKTKKLTEYVDIYPTLCELCGISIPETAEGNSLVPLLKNPSAEWKDHVICKYHDGLSIKTPKYLYTEWRNEQDSLISNMLYDHRKDMEETNNLADKPEYKHLVDSLRAELLANRGKDYFKPNATSKNE